MNSLTDNGSAIKSLSVRGAIRFLKIGCATFTCLLYPLLLWFHFQPNHDIDLGPSIVIYAFVWFPLSILLSILNGLVLLPLLSRVPPKVLVVTILIVFAVVMLRSFIVNEQSRGDYIQSRIPFTIYWLCVPLAFSGSTFGLIVGWLRRNAKEGGKEEKWIRSL